MNILIVGLGSIAEKHIDSLKSLDMNVNFYALRSDLSAKKRKDVINVFDLKSLKVRLDFAIISNPTNLHKKFIDLLIDLEIDLFIEKPPMETLKGTEELILKIKKKKINTYVACNLRFHPCIVFLKEYTNKSRKINEVNIYCGSYLPHWRPEKDFRQVYSAIPEMGGGVHLDLFHELDYAHWLFGKPIKSKSIRRTVSTLNIPAIDYANYVLEYEEFSVSVILNYYRADSKRTIEILFENETLIIDLIKGTIINHEGKVIFQEKDFLMVDTYKKQMHFFVENFKKNQIQMNTFANSIEVLKTCLSGEITK